MPDARCQERMAEPPIYVRFGGKADIALGSPATWLSTQVDRPLFTLGYSLQAYINTVTLLRRTVTVSSQHCG